MNGTIRCTTCGEKFAVRLNVEEQTRDDPGFAEIHDKADLSETCQHIQAGEEYEVVEVDYDGDDDYWHSEDS